MSQQALLGHRRLRVAAPLVPRDPNEEHRAATPLELFFDLVFVVAVALAADNLHHGIAEGAVAASLLSFVLVFVAVFWAWVNFTWFASAYDTDDLVFRLFVFTTIVGALVFAAGVPRVFEERDFTVVASGFAVMRVALVAQWARVATRAGPRRAAGRRYAVSLLVLQVGWTVVALLSPGWYLVAWLVLSVGEIAAPPWAEAAAPAAWNSEHIAERYGLFMIIVLGESVLAASGAVQTVLDDGGLSGTLVPVLIGGLLILFSIWWTYFERPDDHLLSTRTRTFVWGYLHVVVFGAVAAVGAGLALTVEAAATDVRLGPVATAATVAVPLALYLLSLWAMYVGGANAAVYRFGVPVTALLVLAAAFSGAPVLLMGLAVAGLVAIKTARRLRAGQAR